jgi:cell division protein FtsB
MKIRDLIFKNGFLTVILLFIISSAVNFCVSTDLMRKYRENKRLKANIETLKSEVKRFKTTDNKNAAQVKTLTLTKTELKKQNAELVSELKTMNVKPREVKNIQQVSTQTKYEVELVKKDSVIFDTVQVITYKYADDWIRFEALCPLTGDTCKATIITHDSLLIAQHSKTRKFLCWTWKRYSGQATVKNYNPYSEIKSIRNINIEK